MDMPQALLYSLAALLLVVSVESCSLEGTWYDVASTRSVQFLARIDNQPITGLTLTTITKSDTWTTGLVTFLQSSGEISVALDNGKTVSGWTNVTECSDIVWKTQPVTLWTLLPTVKNVHVIFMNHLDVGYNGIPQVGFIANVLNTYFMEYFPRAVVIAEEVHSGSVKGGFIYTTHPWLVMLYLDCPSNLVLSGVLVQCPTAKQKLMFTKAIESGYIRWHAGPMNMQVELMNDVVLEAGLALSKTLDIMFNSTTTVLSQRDVPGLTQCAIPFFVKNGISAVSVGVNPSSSPPAVPNIFSWQYQGESIIGIWHAGGYPLNPGVSVDNPGGLSIQDILFVPNSDDALAFAFRTDNSGPPMSVSEIESGFGILQAQFPNANVFASTFDRFIKTVNRASLPVVKGEIGDTWIQGIASDPYKMAAYRSIASALVDCFKEGKCAFNDPEVINATMYLIKLPEHTWGLPSVYDDVNWRNEDFEKARNNSNYRNCENSWMEQRKFVNLTFEATEGHPLHSFISKKLSNLKPIIPSLSNFIPVDPVNNFTLFNATLEVHFDPVSGAITWLNYLRNDYSYVFADINNPLAVISYHTYNESDFDAMAAAYDYYGNAGFDKPNVTQNANPNSSIWQTSLRGLYRSKNNQNEFLLNLCFKDSLAHEYYGAPQEMWLSINFSASDTVVLEIDLLMVNKTATRLPEALMFEFLPKGSMWIGEIEKISSDLSPKATIEITSVVLNGSQHQHVAEKVYMNSIDEQTPFGVILESLESPLVCPITTNTPATPFPVPLKPISETSLIGIAFNIHNNIWNTNYPLWYPFHPDDKEFKSHFKVSFVVK